MFKKLKDKLAEEVKSSPQRIQQFAQAAQAAVTSASSSISDVTNSDLFSIGDNDSQSLTNKASSSNNQLSSFQNVSLTQAPSLIGTESTDYLSGHDIMENPRQRRLSNSSLASDVSFRLPSYESPSMYHLQSDMEVSASEAEERSFSSGTVSLDRVTKEQLYAAYRRTQDRYSKYRSQYADLARHYKLLERENAKARSVLVETQDKALRRISELREQCSLEQSAKAHLEKALRVDIEERNMKIDALNTKINILQNLQSNDNAVDKLLHTDNDVQLIDLAKDDDINDVKIQSNDNVSSNDTILNAKIEKLEQLLNKYKESLKTSKDKNSQVTTELQILSNEMDNVKRENEKLKTCMQELTEARSKIEEMNMLNEELQNKINSYDFSKSKEISSLEIDLQKSQEEISNLQSKIIVFTKREEEYAISLAENKLSIHKELESKESEIKSLKDSLSASKTEVQSLNIIIDDYKTHISGLENKTSKLKVEIEDLVSCKSKLLEIENQFQAISNKYQAIELQKSKKEEEVNCLQLEIKQETAEKLALKDRNAYLENRITQLTDDNTKKCSQISDLEKQNESLLNKEHESKNESNQIEFWKSKYSLLESEMQEEREELVKLQTEIEKLLANHELLQNQNIELRNSNEQLQTDNSVLHENVRSLKNISQKIFMSVTSVRSDLKTISDITQLFNKEIVNSIIPDLKTKLNVFLETKINHNHCDEKYMILKKELERAAEENKLCLQIIDRFKIEKNELISKTEIYETKISDLHKEIINIKDQNKISGLEESNILKNDKIKLETKLHNLESLYECLQKSVDHDKSHYLAALDKIKVLEDNKQTLQKRYINIEKENESLNIEVEKLKVLHKDNTLQLNSLNAEKKVLHDTLIENNSTIKTLESKIELLLQEKDSLSQHAEIITNNVKELEQEINEVRKSHDELEIEKDRLNSVIEVLEKREQKDSVLGNDNHTQTEIVISGNGYEPSSKLEYSNLPYSDCDTVSLIKDIKSLTDKNSEYEKEIKSLKEINSNLSYSKDTEDVNKNINDSDINIIEKYETLNINYNLLKEENKRYHSDIEGLQAYLSKISKENGLLNDKLRELIASSEHSSGKSELHGIDNDLSEKIQALTRENTLLIEENLELKDQLYSHNYVEPIKSDTVKCSKDSHTANVDNLEKYNNLLINKNKLEEKLMNLEQINDTLNGNMQHIQNSNEKLRTTNEKLERRLDEALVSLRHLHSLQENTELEYLRNILFEYLTGSGTHSITLAKVLAAVVKFDDKQTQSILQKEKERQGLLRQLGLL